MTRQRAQLWMLGLLPLLVVRLLLPTGVMPARGSHGLALVLCGSTHLRPAPEQRHSHADTPCPFAAAAVAAPTDTPAQPALLATRSALAQLAISAQCPLHSAVARSQTARGPPSYS
jgi:hypothetical protein